MIVKALFLLISYLRILCNFYQLFMLCRTQLGTTCHWTGTSSKYHGHKRSQERGRSGVLTHSLRQNS